MQRCDAEVMRLSLFALAATLATASNAMSAPWSSLEIEAVKSMTTQQVGQLADRQMESAGRYVVVLWPFDSESFPRRGSKRAVAFLLVAMGDIDEYPVGALVWTTEAVDLKLEKAD